MRERVARLEQAITEAVKLVSPALQQVINDLHALRGIADISAVTIAAELGQVSRFDSARQLMGYCGAVPSEDSSGKRIRATRTCDESLSKQLGVIVVHQESGMDCAEDKRAFQKRSKRLRGKRNTTCTSTI